MSDDPIDRTVVVFCLCCAGHCDNAQNRYQLTVSFYIATILATQEDYMY